MSPVPVTRRGLCDLAMFDHNPPDQRPGRAPDIGTEGDSVVFFLDVPGCEVRLKIRCDPNGAISVSIVSTRPTESVDWRG